MLPARSLLKPSSMGKACKAALIIPAAFALTLPLGLPIHKSIWIGDVNLVSTSNPFLPPLLPPFPSLEHNRNNFVVHCNEMNTLGVNTTLQVPVYSKAVSSIILLIALKRNLCSVSSQREI